MKIMVKVGDFRTENVDAIGIGIFEGDESFIDDRPIELDTALDGAIKNTIELGDFKGELKQTAILYTHGKIQSPRVALVGLGKLDKLDIESVRQISAKSLTFQRDLGVKRSAAPIPLDTPSEMIQAAVVATKLGLYRFDPHKTVDLDKIKNLDELTFLVDNESEIPRIEKAIEIGEIIADGTILARDLTNQPANYLTPTILAQKAEEIAEKNGLKCEIFDRAKLEAENFGAMIGVAQGSHEEPQFIILEHDPDRDDADTIVLVGKGITFDSGGLSIKSGKGMMTMKRDMAGAAAVLGAMQVIGQLKPDLRVIALIAATENMPSGTAQRPGDVARSYGGKTIEVLNTDAEGRLVLADALGYAKNYQPKAVIDLATLTGAVVTALGRFTAGVMGTDQSLIDKLRSAGEKTHERVWQLPLWNDYDKALKSDIADVKNIGDGTAGSIAGGAFLKTFTDGYSSWAHIDISGTADYVEGSEYLPKSSSGYGVRLLVQLIRDWS